MLNTLNVPNDLLKRITHVLETFQPSTFATGVEKPEIVLLLEEARNALEAATTPQEAPSAENEAASRRQNDIIQHMVDHSANVLYSLVYRDGVTLTDWCSANLERLTGWTVAEAMTGDWWLENVHPEDLPRALTGAAQALELGQWEHEYRFRRRDGSYLWILDRIRTSERMPNGDIRIVGNWADIDARKAVEFERADLVRQLQEREAALLELAERQTLILDALPANIALLNAEGELVSVNQSWRRFARQNGYPEASQCGVGENYLQVCRQCDEPAAARAAAAISAVLEGRLSAYTDEYTCDAPNQPRWFRLLVAPLPGRNSGAVVMHIDMTDRRLAERELLNKKELLETVFSHIPVMICSMQEDGTLNWVNDEWSRVLGWSLEEATSQNLTAELLPTSPAREDAIEFIREGSGEWREFQIARKDGSLVETQWANVILSDGNTLGFGKDISQRKRLELQYQQAQKLEGIGRLAGGIAHDFNNLLSAILGYSEMAMTRASGDSTLKADLEQVLAAARKAANLTRQLLLFARRDTGAVSVFQVDEMILASFKMLRRLVSEDVELVFMPLAENARISLNPAQFEQVLMNLVVNGRDAMPQGGKLVVTTSAVKIRDRQTEAAFLVPGDYVKISVSDTGCGIAPEIVPHIFEPFFTTKPVGAGTGLGLATSYGIAHEAGGTITLESTLGVGTTFHVYFPQSEAAVEIDDSDEREAPHGTETILLVEDEELVRTMAARGLRSAGYQVLEAESGSVALQKLEQHDIMIDLVVTDLVMPLMSGRELSERLLRLRPDVKLLFISGYTDDTVMQHGIMQNTINFLPKPFTCSELARKVREVLDGEALLTPKL